MAELAAAPGGRNTWLKAPPVRAETTYVKPVSLRLVHAVRLKVAGTSEFTVSACATSSGLNTICSCVPGRLSDQPNCLLLAQVDRLAQQTVALVVMSRFCVAALTVTVWACRFAAAR